MKIFLDLSMYSVVFCPGKILTKPHQNDKTGVQRENQDNFPGSKNEW